jgi:hypothetical protein
VDKPKQLTPAEVDHAVSELRRQLQGLEQQLPARIDCSQETIEQGLAKLVLGLIELLRQLLERQAIRRMEGGTLSEQQVEEMGLALMKLEEKIKELAQQFGLTQEDLKLNLGPLGNLSD